MTKREFRRLKAGNLVQEAVSDSLWVVVDRRRSLAPCLILARAALAGHHSSSGRDSLDDRSSHQGRRGFSRRGSYQLQSPFPRKIYFSWGGNRRKGQTDALR